MNTTGDKQLLFQTEIIEDCRSGKNHVLSNIKVCENISDFMSPTLGPYGLDKMFYGEETLITNDGATILSKMNFTDPIAKLITQLSKTQDDTAGDGTTTVVLLGTEILKNCKALISENSKVEEILRVFPYIRKLLYNQIKDYAVEFSEDVLIKLCETCLTSKNVRNLKLFFSNLMVNSKFTKVKPIDSIVEEVSSSKEFNAVENKVLYVFQQGGSLEDSHMVPGIAFEKTFTYAGYEQQPKLINKPTIAFLNIELEWRNEKEDSEVKILSVDEYEKFVNAEYKILYNKLEDLVEAGVNIVLSSQAIGDLATQYFAKKGIFSAGRVKDLDVIAYSLGGRVSMTTKYLSLGSCDLFEEKQLGNKRFNYFIKEKAKVCTLIVRGPSKYILDEVERSLHDAECVIDMAMIDKKIITGGGSIEMAVASILRDAAMKFDNDTKFILLSIAGAMEKIPIQLSENFGQDAIKVVQNLRKKHAESPFYGVTLSGVADMKKLGVFEPLSIKMKALIGALDLAELVLKVDGTILSKQ